MGKASTNKKVARAAKTGAAGGLSRRAGTTSWGYYGSLVGAVIVGTVLIVVSLAGRGDAGPQPPTLNDHWHAAYGIYDCDRYLPPINGELFVDVTGIHAHDDGLIHIHPFTSAVTGKRAVLGAFADTTQMELSQTRIRHEQTGVDLKADQKCGEKTATVRYLSFASPADTKPVELTGDPNKIRLTEGLVIAMVRAPKDATIPAPPSAAGLASPADLQTSVPTDSALPNSGTSALPNSGTSALPNSGTSALPNSATSTPLGATTTGPAVTTTTS